MVPNRPSGQTCVGAAGIIPLRTMAGGSVDLETVLRLISNGDRVAFRQLYDEVAGRMLATARRILGDQALAEDAVQDAFMRIWRSAGSFDPSRGVALAWIGRIVRNASFDRLPAQRDDYRIEDVDIAVMPVEPADARVAQCLKRLPEQQGKALVLMYVHGLTHPELAAQLGAPLGTVKSWIRRGAAGLRQCMGVES